MGLGNQVVVTALPESCAVLDEGGTQRYEAAFKASARLSGYLRSFILEHGQAEQSVWLKASIAGVLFQPWSMEILFATGLHESMRFSEYQRLLGISPRTLSARLKEMQDAGFLERTVHDETPVRVTYTLSKHGNATAVFAIPLLAHLHREATARQGAQTSLAR
jgi:DNA-binding HxlR family transcriptional regulator